MTRRARTASTLALALAATLGAPFLGAAGVFAVPGSTAAAQVVEEVWAVVNDSVILKTEVDQEYFRTLAQLGVRRRPTPEEEAQLKRQVLEQLINQQLVIQDAARDTTLRVDPEELEARVQAEVDAQVRQFGTLSRFQEALSETGQTLATFREQQREAIRRQILMQRYIAKRGEDARRIAITDEELQAYFERNKARIPRRPATVRFEHVILRPEPTDSAKAAALALARQIRDRARDGEDFATLAQRYSADPGTKDEGGLLGWVREGGGLTEKFEDAVFRLRPGVVSDPVETEFGYHVILVERVRGGERRVRHVLVRWELGEDDIDRNVERANALLERARAGEALADLGTPDPPDTLEVAVNQLARLSPFYARALQDATPGAVLGPLELPAAGEHALTLVHVLEVKPGGEASIEDVRDRLEENLRQEKLVERVVQGLRDQAYIEVRVDGGGTTGGG